MMIFFGFGCCQCVSIRGVIDFFIFWLRFMMIVNSKLIEEQQCQLLRIRFKCQVLIRIIFITLLFAANPRTGSCKLRLFKLDNFFMASCCASSLNRLLQECGNLFFLRTHIINLGLFLNLSDLIIGYLFNRNSIEGISISLQKVVSLMVILMTRPQG